MHEIELGAQLGGVLVRGRAGERLAGGLIMAGQVLHEAVAAQRKVWGATYRILAGVGRADQRVASLLKEAAR